MSSLSRLPAELPQSDLPLHERLADAIEQAVASGSIGPGDRLPPHREISTHFGVAIGTVTKAIDSLSRRGIVRGEVGRGTFVRDVVPVAAQAVDLTINAPLPVIKPEIMQAAAERGARYALDLPHGGYVNLTGTAPQRASVANWLARTRLQVSAEEIVLCTGAQQAIHLAFAELRSRSAVIVTEAHSFPGALAAAANLQMRMVGVGCDAEGMLPGELDRTLSETASRIVYVTPVCQNPMGFETGPARRAEILAVCQKHDAFLVEDDIYGLYAAKGGATYKQMDPARVWFVSSLSKCLTPLVRLGVLVPPSEYRQSVARRLRAEAWGASPLALAIGCALLDLDADVAAAEALRNEARNRLALARQIFPQVEFPMPEGAPHVWLPMPLLDAERLARRSSERGVRLTPPGASLAEGRSEGGLRICILAPQRATDLAGALATVAELMHGEDETFI